MLSTKKIITGILTLGCLNNLESKVFSESKKSIIGSQAYYSDEKSLYDAYLKIEEKFVKNGKGIIGYRTDDISKKIPELYSLLIEIYPKETKKDITKSVDSLYKLYDESINSIIVPSIQKIFSEEDISYKIKENELEPESDVGIAIYKTALYLIKAEKSYSELISKKEDINQIRLSYEGFLDYILKECFPKNQIPNSSDKANIIETAGVLTLFNIRNYENEFKTKNIFKRFIHSENDTSSFRSIRGIEEKNKLVNTKEFMINLLKTNSSE